MPHGQPRQRVKLMGAFYDAPLMVQRPQARALRRPPGSRLSRGHWLSQLDVIVARADRSGRKGLGGTMNEVTSPTARIGWYDAVSQADERWFEGLKIILGERCFERTGLLPALLIGREPLKS
jgi:hypothetical protein